MQIRHTNDDKLTTILINEGSRYVFNHTGYTVIYQCKLAISTLGVL